MFDVLEELLGEIPARARGIGTRLGEGGQDALRTLARELGLVTREDYDELELRVAQLEHRLRLLEEPRPLPSPDR